jgi:hypothetical protein
MTTEQNGLRNVEDDIDVALKMLGEMQAPATLVSRVHQGLETAAMSQPPTSSRRFLIPAAGMAAAALIFVALFSQMHRTHEYQAVAVETAKLIANTSPARPTVMPQSATAETERSDGGKRLVQYSTKRRSRQSRENRHATNLLSYPLTREEKLLLQFAHNAKPADLQALNPEYQAKVEARQEAEFAAYLKSGNSSETESATQTTESSQE